MPVARRANSVVFLDRFVTFLDWTGVLERLWAVWPTNPKQETPGRCRARGFFKASICA